MSEGSEEPPEKKVKFTDPEMETGDAVEPPDKRAKVGINMISVNHVNICEVLSQPRVTQMSGEVGLEPGWAIDVNVKEANGESWGLRKKTDQQEVMKMLARDDPDMLTGSPPCTMFSQMQSRNKNKMARDIWE